MLTAETGGAGHRLGSVLACLSAALVLLLVIAAPDALAAGKKPDPAAQVPLPQLRPAPADAAAAADPAVSDDAIGALISSAPDENGVAEDSDTPQAFAPTDTADLPPVPTPAPAAPASLNSAGLKLALKFLDDGDPAAATVAAYALPDPVDIKIIDWLVAISGSDAVPPSRIQAVSRKLSDWPGQGLLHLRFEQAVARDKLPAADVIKALGGSAPTSDSAVIALAQAYVATGRQKDAAALIRSFWRNENLSLTNEKTVVSVFGDFLTAGDHKARMDRLLYNGRLGRGAARRRPARQGPAGTGQGRGRDHQAQPQRLQGAERTAAFGARTIRWPSIPASRRCAAPTRPSRPPIFCSRRPATPASWSTPMPGGSNAG